MVRHLHVTMDDDDFEQLSEVKGDRDWEDALMEDMVGTVDLGDLHAAGVRDVDGQALLTIKGTHQDATVLIPEDKAVAFRATAREVVLVYDEDAIEPGDEEVLIGGQDDG